MTHKITSALLGAALGASMLGQSTTAAVVPHHTFSIGDEAFLLDGKPYVIRTGEMHFARVPRECWRHRLQLTYQSRVRAK